MENGGSSAAECHQCWPWINRFRWVRINRFCPRQGNHVVLQAEAAEER